MFSDDRHKIEFNEKLIQRLIDKGTAVVFTLNKQTGLGDEIISWNTTPKFYPPEMQDSMIRIGYLLERAREVGLDDMAMPDQRTDAKLVEECHELTIDEIKSFYSSDKYEKEGTIWNVDKFYNAIFMKRETYEAIKRELGKDVALVFPAADCAVVRFYDPVHDVIGLTHSDAVHTGRGIIPKCVKYMCDKFGSNSSDIEAYVGAFATEGWTYDKIPDFAATRDDKGEIIKGEDGKPVALNGFWKPYIDKREDGLYEIKYGEVIYDQLVGCGLNIENISFSPDNTLFNDAYFSNSRSYNSRVDGVATYRDGRNLMGITFGKQKLLDEGIGKGVKIS